MLFSWDVMGDSMGDSMGIPCQAANEFKMILGPEHGEYLQNSSNIFNIQRFFFNEEHILNHRNTNSSAVNVSTVSP